MFNIFLVEYDSIYVVLYVIFFYYFYSKIKIQNENNNKFDNVIGLEPVKSDLEQYIDYIENRKKYKSSGFKIPKGLLFIGPPGTGKTLLARQLSKKTKSKFYYRCGSDFAEMWVGLGSKRIRDLFKKAKSKKSAIIFIDEIDSIGRKRSFNNNNERDSTLNSLLVEMDGFDENDNILVIGSTNMVSSLDPALLRSGRFDKKIIFDKPNINERELLFKLYLNKIKLDFNFKQDYKNNIYKLARLTANLTGADIQNICNQSIGLFLKRNKNILDNENEKGVTISDLFKSIDDIMIGMQKKERLMTESEKKIVAFHEAGHALISYILKETRPPIKVSIIPRGESALGFSMQEPVDKKLYSKNELISKICVLLGGRISEEINFKKITTGASDDIYKLTKIAYSIVTTYGMSNLIGNINMNREKNVHYDVIDISENKKEEIDSEVNKIINKCYNFTKYILEQNIISLTLLGNYLFENEEIIYSDFNNIFNNVNLENSMEINLDYKLNNNDLNNDDLNNHDLNNDDLNNDDLKN